jgi:hypothetical protein
MDHSQEVHTVKKVTVKKITVKKVKVYCVGGHDRLHGATGSIYMCWRGGSGAYGARHIARSRWLSRPASCLSNVPRPRRITTYSVPGE